MKLFGLSEWAAIVLILTADVLGLAKALHDQAML